MNQIGDAYLTATGRAAFVGNDPCARNALHPIGLADLLRDFCEGFGAPSTRGVVRSEHSAH
jgi:hypothetical protein